MESSTAENCLFCKITHNEIPSTKVYEDDDFLAFNDINPAAPVHVLVVPKKHIARLSLAQNEDKDMLGAMMLVIGHVSRELQLEGYRLIINDGPAAGQTVFHLHAHILGGTNLGEKLL